MNKKEKYPEPIAGALIVNKNKKLLFCKSQKWNNKYTIFGGHIEIGEPMEKAVVREVKEETGLKVKAIARLGISDSIFDPGFYKKKHFIFIDFLCKYDGGDDKIKINEEFMEDYGWFNIKEAEKIRLAKGARLIFKEYKNYLKSNTRI